MNKKIIILLALLIVVIFAGCSGSVNADNSVPIEIESEKFEMDYITSDMFNWVGSFYLYEDKETTVEYIVFDNNGYISITPRYNADGTLKTHKQ